MRPAGRSRSKPSRRAARPACPSRLATWRVGACDSAVLDANAARASMPRRGFGRYGAGAPHARSDRAARAAFVTAVGVRTTACILTTSTNCASIRIRWPSGLCAQERRPIARTVASALVGDAGGTQQHGCSGRRQAPLPPFDFDAPLVHEQDEATTGTAHKGVAWRPDRRTAGRRALLCRRWQLRTRPSSSSAPVVLPSRPRSRRCRPDMSP